MEPKPGQTLYEILRDKYKLPEPGTAQYESDLKAPLPSTATHRRRSSPSTPVDCWCNGFGGRGRKDFGNGRYIFEEYCVCAHGIAAKEYDADWAGPMLQQRRDWNWLKAAVPPKLRECRLQTSPHEDIAMLMAEGHGRSWYLWGAYGVGKSGLAVGYLWEWVQADKGEALFITVPDIFMAIRSTYGDKAGRREEEVIETYRAYPLLIMDDLGSEKVTDANRDWVEDRLMAIVGHRHGHDMTTVFTSNLDIGSVAERVGQRVSWRIVELCGHANILEVRGANLRA